MTFRTGKQAAKPFEVLQLPLDQRRELVLELMEEFGAESLTVQRHEIVHRCNLPPPVGGHHANGDRTPSARFNFEKMTMNCFAGETLVRVRDEGAVPMRELARRGVATILDGDGRWVRCPINTFPEQRLWRVTMTRNKVVREFYATANHRWLKKGRGRYADGRKDHMIEVSTDHLKPGDRLPSVWSRKVRQYGQISSIGVARGFAYGDGSLSQWRIVSGIPRSWKIDLPLVDDGDKYLYGWLAGYFAADGSVTDQGHPRLSSANRPDLDFVQTVCDHLGIRYFDITSQEREGFPGRDLSMVYQISIDPDSLSSEFFIIDHHRERWLARDRKFARHGWVVQSVEMTDRVEEVYCPSVPTTESFVLDGNVCSKNCWSCGGGGFLWWIATMRGEENMVGVRDWLATRTGIGGVQGIDELLAFIDSVLAEPERFEQQTIPHYDRRILDGWAFIHPYLTAFRRLPIDNLIASNIGYSTFNVPMGDNVFKSSERITIPHFWRGQLVGWQSRRLFDDGTPKYLSTPSFPKDTTLYNFDVTAPTTVIVEAPISAVAQRHNAHVEATFGASVTVRQMDLIAQHDGEIVLWMDNDPAGWKSTCDIGEYLIERTSRVYVIDSPFAADPADLDSDTFLSGLTEWRVPFVLWNPPSSLLEWNPTHDQEVRPGTGNPK